MKRIVVYLDLLGFSNHTKENLDGAIREVENPLLSLGFGSRFDREKYADSYLGEEAQRRGVSTFKYYLPYFDSVVIVGDIENADLFLYQVGYFILRSFNQVSQHLEFPINDDDPTKVVMHGDVDEETNFYPTMFRGGITIGEVELMRAIRIIEGQRKNVYFCIGEALTEAVQLEQSGIKGPKIVFREVVYSLLSEEFRQRYVRQISDNLYEFLWPALNYFPLDMENFDVMQFDDLFNPAITLFNHFRAETVHYLSFIESIIASSIQAFSSIGREAEIRRRITDSISHIFNNAQADDNAIPNRIIDIGREKQVSAALNTEETVATIIESKCSATDVANKSVVLNDEVQTPLYKDIDTVVINNVEWATKNIDQAGIFVSSFLEYGKNYTWKELQNICPDGFHVPTNEEFNTLLDETKVHQEWITYQRTVVCKFTDLNSGNYIFFLSNNKGYWSYSQRNFIDLAYYLRISARDASICFDSRGICSFSVRPVKGNSIIADN
jgi:uncharacterized protein (TIGR02145 family)